MWRSGLKGIFFLTGAVLMLFSSAVFAQDSAVPEEPDPLALEAQRILKERCANCHNGQKREGGRLSVEDYEVLTETVAGETYETFVKPGSLKESGIWDQVAVLREMPKNGDPLSKEELSTLRSWIEKGAPSWETSRKIDFVTEQQQLKAIRDFLTDAEPRKIPQLRFFTLANIYNDPSYSERDLNLHRAALSKAVNAMSRAGAIVLPTAIDTQKTIYAVNISELGWQNDWKEVVRKYPYGVKPLSNKGNPDVRRLYDAIEKLYTSAGAEFDGVAVVRGDWFVARATRPELYHRLSGTPTDLAEFFRQQGIRDFATSFKEGTLKRAGMFRSGVSSQNRLVEVHRDGRVWMSYDFKRNNGDSNLSLRPLGPQKTPGNEAFAQFAFQHDGGEVIYERDNGLHGYLLIGLDKDGKGVRINEGPVDIVYDVTQVSGSPLIVNGLSCMSCHKAGLKDLSDDIREGHSVKEPAAAEQVKLLYPPREEMTGMIDKANQKFQEALRETIGAYFDKGQDLMKLPEPIGYVAQNFDHNVTLQRAALELGLADVKELEFGLKGRQISEFGLAPLGQPNGSIKRGFWENTDGVGASVFQKVALLLGLGSSVN